MKAILREKTTMFKFLLRYQHIPLHRIVVLLVHILVLILLFATVIVSSIGQKPIQHFFKDTNVIAGQPFYFGAMSNIGIIFWCATASICLLSSLILHTVSRVKVKKQFLFYAGFFTLFLMLDDLFLIHEEVFPNYLGLSDSILYLAYGVISLVWLLNYRKIISQTDYSFLLISFFLFAGSLVVDILDDSGFLFILNPNLDGFYYFLEDGFKLLGITGWFSYFVLVCHSTLVKLIAMELVPNSRSN